MGHDSPSIDSIFDYLYVDHVRIASYLGQLSNHGHLSSVSVEDRTEHRSSGGITAGVAPLGVGKFETNFGSAQAAFSASSLNYDALWVNARSILDKLDELGRVQKKLPDAEVGQIVVVSGEFCITDLRIMRPIWGPMFNLVGHNVEVPKQFQGMRRHERRRGEKHARKDAKRSEGGASPQQMFLEVVARFFEEMPHAVQGTIVGDTGTAWFTMNPERMTVSPEELALEHGEVLPGRWQVVGVVDAIPGELPRGPEPQGAAQATRLAMAAVREQLGRPATSYGLTPLMVFRKVGPATSALSKT